MYNLLFTIEKIYFLVLNVINIYLFIYTNLKLEVC